MSYAIIYTLANKISVDYGISISAAIEIINAVLKETEDKKSP